MGTGIVPDRQSEAISFFLSRLAQWAANASTIGYSAQQVTTMTSLVGTAQNALNQAEVARNASKDATLALNAAIEAMRSFGGDMIKIARTTAEITNNPTIYQLASIPPISPPTPLGPPEAPVELTSTLLVGGKVSLQWKGSRQGGTSFSIYRSLKTPGGDAGPFHLIGISEQRRFTDETLPTGLQNATYYVVAQRSGGNSPNSDPTVIYFGQVEGNPVTGKKNLGIAA